MVGVVATEHFGSIQDTFMPETIPTNRILMLNSLISSLKATSSKATLDNQVSFRISSSLLSDFPVSTSNPNDEIEVFLALKAK